MTQFKVGHRVQQVESSRYWYQSERDIGTVECIYSNGFARVNWDHKGSDNYPPDCLKLVGEAPEIHFILQYELDRDPFETFSTLKEVEARIKELAKRTDLKRESIKVYEIAKTYDVTLETRILFGNKVRLTEQKRRDRPSLKDMTPKEKRAAYYRKWYRKNKAKVAAKRHGATQ